MTRSESPRRRWGARRWVPALPALLVALVALWEIVATARAGHDTGHAADWTAAAEAVRAGYAPGDLIVFAPGWIDPVGRQHLGDLLSLDAAARMDGETYGTIWEVSVRGAVAAETVELTPYSETDHGDVRVRKFVRDAEDVAFDFVDRFADAEVRGAVASPPQVLIEEVGFDPHRCVRIEPKPGRTAEVVYDDVLLGSSLVGYVGLADVFTLRRVRDSARLEVRVDGRAAATVTAGVDDGWKRFEVATDGGSRARVVFAATALGDGAVDRLVCFAAEARR